jgi:hypothetical protein
MKKYNDIKVLNLDGVPDSMGETFDCKGVTAHPEVPIYWNHDTSKQIGVANLYVLPTTEHFEGMYANLEITDPDVEAVIVPIYPSVGGKTYARDSNNKNILTSVQVTYINLDSYPNCDHRIQPLGMT